MNSLDSSRAKIPAARLLALAMLPLLGGCTLDPVDLKPEQKTPAAWSSKAADNAAVSDEWWKDFHDTGLDTVVARALAASPDLDAAYARVRSARAAAGLADSGFWPTLGANGSAGRSRMSGSNNFRIPGRTNDNYSVGGSIAYEVDLWGRVRNESRAAEAEYRSSHADLAGARLLVAAETAGLWFDLRQAKAERAILADELTSRTQAHALYAAREKAGLIGGDEVARAKLNADQTRYELDGIELKVALLRNALAAAVGEFPGSAALPEPSGEIPVSAPAVPLCLPSALVKARPDIASADLRLDAALAREGAARAAFFPNLTLSATGGFSSINAGDLFNSQSRVWSIGPQASLPLFTGGRNDANLEQARAAFDATWAAYRKTILGAFRETEDALVTLDRLDTQEKSVAAIVASANDTLTFARARFDKGLSSNLEVTLAERDALSAKRSLVAVRFDRLRASVNLARALGGGWHRDTAIDKSAAAFEQRLDEREAALEKAKADRDAEKEAAPAEAAPAAK